MRPWREDNPPYYLSAYGIACKFGFKGTQEQWLTSLTAYGVACTNGYQGTQEEWLTSLTAYGVACANGYKGTIEEWLESLKGEKGDSVTLVNSVTEYQVGDSGKDVPTGKWTQTIPETTQGKYLWTKTELQFNRGDPIISYSVARMGIDGLGSVSSVAGVSPDETGNVRLDAANVGALAVSGGTMTGSIAMGGNQVTGLGTPTDATDAVPKAYAVDMKLAAVTLTAAGWANGTQTVAAEGVTADDAVTAIITTAAADSVDAYLDSGIKCAGQGDGTLTFTCTTAPGTDIAVNLIILKKGGWAA